MVFDTLDFLRVSSNHSTYFRDIKNIVERLRDISQNGYSVLLNKKPGKVEWVGTKRTRIFFLFFYFSLVPLLRWFPFWFPTEKESTYLSSSQWGFGPWEGQSSFGVRIIWCGWYSSLVVSFPHKRFRLVYKCLCDFGHLPTTIKN